MNIFNQTQLLKIKDLIEPFDIESTLDSQKINDVLKNHIQTFILEFQKVSFSKSFGFDAFNTEDLIQFLCDESQLNLKLKKERGKGLLYGRIHTELRRQFVNQLPDSIRKGVLLSKLNYYQLIPKLHIMLGKKHQEVRLNSTHIVDIKDIGMAHSVYFIHLSLPEQSYRFVIKKEESPNQTFFCRLLTMLNWQSYKSVHMEGLNGSWQLSDYLPGVNGYDALNAMDSQKDRDCLEQQFARYAALGDILGSGDRHFENYIVLDKHLFNVDISILFWQGNEEWIKKYVMGGQYEINCLIDYVDNAAILEEKIDLFWMHYCETMTELRDKKDIIISLINRFYGEKQTDTIRKIQFVTDRLLNLDNYIESQKKLYIAGFKEMITRHQYKRRLEEKVTQTPDLLKDDYLLKMYYLANKNRYSTFFLLEDQSKTFIEKLKN